MLISRAVSSSGVVYVNTNTSNKSSNLRYSPKIHTWNYLNDLKGNQDTYLSILSSHWTPHPKHLHCVASARKKIWFPLHYVYQPPSFLPKKKKKTANPWYTPFKQNISNLKTTGCTNFFKGPGHFNKIISFYQLQASNNDQKADIYDIP